MARYASLEANKEAAHAAALKTAMDIRTDWTIVIISNDNYSKYNIVPYKRQDIADGTRLHAYIVVATGEIAKDGDKEIGQVTVRHAFAYPV